MLSLDRLVLCALLASATTAQDWPAFRADASRSGATTHGVQLPLRQAWVYRAKHEPRPAWPGPARHDLYNKALDLKPRLQFDRAFQVAAANDRVWFGSSADDQVRCIDAQTGEEKWTFFTEAPVRFAPVLSKGALLFGSDDGHVYCVDALTGKLFWKKRPGPDDTRIPGNGRIISKWPIRTGLVPQGNNVYFCAGLFPTAGVELCALRIRDGHTLWKQTVDAAFPQGYMLASSKHLYVPTGRGNPIVFARENGKKIRQVGGQGGTFALLAGDSLIYGPGKTGQLAEYGQDHLATFTGNQMIVDGETAYLLNDHELARLRRAEFLKLTAEKRKLAAERKKLQESLGKKPKPGKLRAVQKKQGEIGERVAKIDDELRACFVWRQPCDLPLELVRAGDHLFAGGDRRVAAFDVSDGREVWSAPVEGRAFGLAVADGRLLVSTDTGRIHGFATTEEAR